MRKLLLRWLINTAAVYVAVQVIPGIQAVTAWDYFGVALVLGLLNALIAPILKVLTCPLILLTLGAFTLVINAAMLLLAKVLSPIVGASLTVDSFGTAVLASLIISVVSFALTVLTGANKEKDRNRRR
ncbi:MAG: phage holin family protein [Anaerolineae bacterium]|nr:phage holin family protein [Anaerolineae bacterium]